MKNPKSFVYENSEFEAVLVVDDRQQNHRAFVEVVRALEQSNAHQLVGTVYINSVCLNNLVYTRKNDNLFLSKCGHSLKLLSKLT